MKKYTYFICFLLLGISIMSCNKDDEETPEKLDPQGDCFTAKIDGELFESDNVTATSLGLFMSVGATFGTTDVPTFGLTLLNTAEGTYSFTGQAEVVGTYSPGALTSTVIYGSTSGSLTITENDTSDKRIKGTFNFTGEGDAGATIQVTEGLFDVGY